MVWVMDSKDISIIYQILVRFIPEVAPLPDEVEAIKAADYSIARFGTIDYADVDWG